MIPFRRLLSGFRIALAASVLLAGSASAQLIQLDALPDDDAAPVAPGLGESQGLATDRQPDYSQEEAELAPSIAAADVLLPLRAVRPQLGELSRYTLRGEVDEAEFVLFVPSATAGTTLQLATLSTINVLPERSSLEAFVNGVSVGTIAPENFDGYRMASLPIPAGVLNIGRNIVKLRAMQTHRVFCGPDADFGLWTTVALDRSGVMLGSGEFGTDPLSFLAALAAQSARGQAIGIHGSGDEATLRAAVPMIARIEDSFGGSPPTIDVKDYYTSESGLPELARVTSLPPGLALDGGFAIRRGGDGAIVLVVENGAYEAGGEALLAAMPEGVIETAAPRLAPGAPVSFGELGLENIKGAGRYIRKSVTFRLPQDWLLLASQEARMRLLYRYDTGLPKGALLLIKVNGTTVRLLPLDLEEEAGKPLPLLPVNFGAAMLNPGLNRIDFEALVPGDPPDRACELRSEPVFEISNRTSLFVPDSPAMSMPGIERVLANVTPEGVDMSETAAARLPAGLLPQVAAIFDRHGEPLQAADMSAFKLVIGTPQDISLLEGTLAVEHQPQLREALVAPVVAPVQAQAAEPDAWELVEPRGWLAALLRLERIRSVPDHLRKGIEALWRGTELPLDDWLAVHKGQAMLIQPGFETSPVIWLILGPGANPDEIVETLANARTSIEGPKGQVSIYTKDGGWENWVSPDRPLRLHETLTPSNMRAVAGNIASAQPWTFIIIIMTFTLCSAFVAMIVATLARRRRP